MPREANTTTEARPDIFRRAKREIDLVAYACEELGFRVNRGEDSQNHRALEHDDGTRLVARINPGNGEWIYFQRGLQGTRTIVDLLIDRLRLSKSALPRVLRRIVNAPTQTAQNLAGSPSGTVPNIKRVRETQPLSEGAWLLNRGITSAVLDLYRHRVRQDSYGNIIFPHGEADGSTGGEIRNWGLRMKAVPGSTMSLWTAFPGQMDRECVAERIVVCESAVRCFAWAELHPHLRSGTLLVSVSGVNRDRGGLSSAAAESMLTSLIVRYPDAVVIDALDADAAGAAGGTWLQATAGPTRYQQMKPPVGTKDWERALLAHRGLEKNEVTTADSGVYASSPHEECCPASHLTPPSEHQLATQSQM